MLTHEAPWRSAKRRETAVLRSHQLSRLGAMRGSAALTLRSRPFQLRDGQRSWKGGSKRSASGWINLHGWVNREQSDTPTPRPPELSIVRSGATLPGQGRLLQRPLPYRHCVVRFATGSRMTTMAPGEARLTGPIG